MRSKVALALRLAVFLGGYLVPAPAAAAEPSAAANAAFDRYTSALELRLETQHRAASSFLRTEPAQLAQVRTVGEPLVEREAMDALPGAMLHAWRGLAFVPGATLADSDRLMRDFSRYPHVYAPQVLEARVDGRPGDRTQVTMRVRQQHVLTIVMDTSYDVRFSRLDAQHGSSSSRSTRVAEIASAGTAAERVLSPDEEHGFLWRQNTYWSFEERDGGLYLQLESVSLSRSIPHGLGWAVRPFVESVPRESMEFTLRATCLALRSGKAGAR